jgi:predicted permease
MMDQRALPWFDDFQRDIRHAIRAARKRPGASALVVLTLAVAIGGSAAVFTVMNALLLNPLPIRDPGGLVLLGDARGHGYAVGQLGTSFSLFSHDLYMHLRGADAVADLCAVQSATTLVAVRRNAIDPAAPARAKFVSGNYFRLLGANVSMGRTLGPSDDVRGAAPVAVASFGYWQDVLDADPSAIGNTIAINGIAVTLVGVTPAQFHGETIEPDPPRLWLPIAAARAIEPLTNLLDAPDRHFLFVLGRLKPGQSTADGSARLTAALQNWLLARAGSEPSADRVTSIAQSRVELTPARSGIPVLRRTHSQTLEMLLGVSALVVLLACANIAGLLLAREMARGPERAVRRALGANRGRLIRQSLAESMALGLTGGTVALFVGWAGAHALVTLLFAGADDVPIATAPNLRVVLFTLAVCCLAALLFGTAPAWRTRVDLTRPMRDARFRLGKALVVGQVALSLTMVAAAGTLTYSLVNLARQPFGFDPGHTLVMTVDPHLAHYDYDRLAPLYDAIESRLEALPGVTSAALSYYSPFHGCCWSFSMKVPGSALREDENPSAMLNRVSPGYFQTIGTRLVRGRVFDRRDTPAGSVAVVNAAFARLHFPHGDPIGRTFRIDSQPDVDLEIVGVVEDAKYDEPRDAIRPMVFLPLLQMRPTQPVASGEYFSNFITTIEVRTSGDPMAVAPAVRRALAGIDPTLPVLRIDTLEDHIEQGLRREQVSATLASVFAAIALTLACIGLYGVMAYLVQRRIADIGVRMALGATRGVVIAAVMRETLAQALMGVALGIPVSVAGLRIISSQLFGVIDLTPGTLILVAGVLIACLAIAGYLPARQASRLDPVAVLRSN